MPTWLKVENPWRLSAAESTKEAWPTTAEKDAQLAEWHDLWYGAMQELGEEASRGVLVAGLLGDMFKVNLPTEGPYDDSDMAEPGITVQQALDPQRWQRIFNSYDPEKEVEEVKAKEPATKKVSA
ncbi:MAG: hypothetical protein Q9160_008973 [Pyrenula sp. 1 TL-2023]